MLLRSLFRSLRRPSGVVADQRGSITVTFALTLIPMMLVVGLAVDYARMVQFRAALQNAVDQAAIAGASAFSSTSTAATAQTVAKNFFNRALLPPSISRSTPTVTTNASGTINPSLGTASAYTVTVAATAKVSTTLMSLVVPSVTIYAQGTAGQPIVSGKVGFSNVNSVACDGNRVYMYSVPRNSTNNGYDYSSVPTFTTGSGGNYYEIGSSIAGDSLPSGQVQPTLAANQPIGVAMWNQTNGNTANGGCGVSVTGANSYGAPYHAQQWFYSSYLGNNQSPSEQSNYQYQMVVTTTRSGNSSSITSVTGSQYYQGAWISLGNIPIPSSSTYNNLTNYLGINASTSTGNCTSSSTTSGNNTVTTYNCTTQYFTTQTNQTPNCSLYIQTGLTNAQVASLSNSSSAPAAARGNCFSVSGGNAGFAAPSCAQISAQMNGPSTTSTATAASVVFWWDDAGGVGQGEQYYGPSAHCSGTSSGGPGYGEDCQYKNNFFSMSCIPTGGSGSGFTEVALSQ